MSIQAIQLKKKSKNTKVVFFLTEKSEKTWIILESRDSSTYEASKIIQLTAALF